MTTSLLSYINKEIHACNLDIIFNSGYSNKIEITPLSMTKVATLDEYAEEIQEEYDRGVGTTSLSLKYNLNEVFHLIQTLRDMDPKITSSFIKLQGFLEINFYQVMHKTCNSDYLLETLTMHKEQKKYKLLDYIEITEHFAEIDPNDKVLHYINKIIHNCNVAINIASLDKYEDKNFRIRSIKDDDLMSLSYLAFITDKEFSKALDFSGNTYKGYNLDQLQLFLARLSKKDPKLLSIKVSPAGLANITVNEILDLETSVSSILKTFACLKCS